MLKHLVIKNYALIEALEMSPDDHLNVITGETGAGKSIMLGAVGLLLGNRAESKVLLKDETKCVVEGEFKIEPYNLKDFFDNEDLDYENSTLIRREIQPSGKSRAFVNDSPVTLDVLTRLGHRLMDVHSQHENLQLGKGVYQIKLVDSYAGNKNELAEYQGAYKDYKKAKSLYQQLNDKADNLRQEMDYNQFLLEELEEAKLNDLDQENLERELSFMENAEEIKSNLHQASQILKDSDITALAYLSEVKALLNNASKLSDKYRGIFERVESIYLELDDISSEVDSQMENIEFDPQEKDVVKDRLSKLYQLQKKHNVLTVEELRKIEEDLAEKVTSTQNLDERIEKAENDLTVASEKLKEKANILTKTRKDSIEPLITNLQDLLAQLGMPNAKIEISAERADFSSHGQDTINILFSANKGFSPQPIQKVASGGEFSRLIFCIKYILAGKMALPTVVFDEIDTGVSGEIALKLAQMMKEMSKRHQVITISHSPQIAARGNAHYFVFKDEKGHMTTSRIRLLEEDERVEEIAKMIGGDNPPEAAMESAKSLLKLS